MPSEDVRLVPLPKPLPVEFDESIATLVNGFTARGLTLRDAARVLHAAGTQCYDLAVEANIERKVQEALATQTPAKKEQE